MQNLNLKNICINYIIENNIVIKEFDIPYNLFLLINNLIKIKELKKTKTIKTSELYQIYSDITFFRNRSVFYYNLSKTNISHILELKFLTKHIKFERIVQNLLKEVKTLKLEILYCNTNIIYFEKYLKLYN